MANANLCSNVGVEDGDQHDVLHHQPLRGQHVLHHALNITIKPLDNSDKKLKNILFIFMLTNYRKFKNISAK
jgi:hypothetical protein